MLQESGCATLQGYLDITHALLLIDTYWVKPIGSLLKWKDVSLYTHEFNEVIAKTAFEGGSHGRNLSTTSPEYGTDGSFAKCWVREDGQIRMLKRGSSGARNTGLEPYSEYYAAQIAEYFHVPYVKYELRSRSGCVHSVCDIFTSEKYGYLPYNAISNGDTIRSVLRVCAQYGFESRACLKTHSYILHTSICMIRRTTRTKQFSDMPWQKKNTCIISTNKCSSLYRQTKRSML